MITFTKNKLDMFIQKSSFIVNFTKLAFNFLNISLAFVTFFFYITYS